MSNVKKIDEAHAHIRDAEKSLKTSLLKWKPDYDDAAYSYNAAATCYKTMRDYIHCRDCLLKSSENYKLSKSYFAAAKCLEQAALMSKEIGELDMTADLSEKAALLYRDHGVIDTAAITLDKGAKMIESYNPEKALHLYKFATSVVSTDDKPRQASEFQSKATKLLVNLKKYDEAVDSIRREISFEQQTNSKGTIGRLTIALVLVQIARGDTVAAEKAFREWGGYCDSEEANVLESLLRGFDEEDGDLAKRALNAPILRHMDVAYTKLARDLPVPKTSKKQSDDGKGSTYSGAHAEPSTGADDEELNLC